MFVDFSKAFDSKLEGKIGQKLLGYVLHRETVTAIMMLHKNTKAVVYSPSGNSNFFDIITGVLQGDTLQPYVNNLLRLCTMNNNGSNERKWFHTDNIPQKLAHRLSRWVLCATRGGGYSYTLGI